MNIVIIGGTSNSLINFRLDLILGIKKIGKVTALSGEEPSSEELAVFRSIEVEHLSYPLSRNGLNAFDDLNTVAALISIFRKLKPEVVVAYTIKPIIWGSIAARFSSVYKFHAMVTGLGYAFQKEGFKKSVLNNLVKFLYRCSLKQAESVIFQNPDNMHTFIENGIVTAEKCHLVNGSGVNLSHFENEPLPQEPRFLLIARLLGDKGIREYAEAADLVKERYPNATFDLVGPEDPSPDGIDISEINKLHDKGVITYHGATNDVRPYIKDCSIFVLPSYHEGMPRTVLEAMAMGRPILTTDVPGCRETVVNGENGWLVEKANVDQLAERMIWFIENQEQWSVMGNKSHAMANEKFDVHKVNAEILKIMGLSDEKTV